MEELGGLVAHPLVIHVPVVLIPLAAIGVIALAVRPRLHRSFGVLVASLAGIGFVGAVLASRTGEALEERFEEGGQTMSATLEHHAELGESAPIVAGLFFVAVLVWVLFTRWRARAGEERVAAVARKPAAVAGVLLALSVLAGIAASVTIVRTGHSGAESVWEDASAVR